MQISKDEFVIKVGNREQKRKYKLDPSKKPKHMVQTFERNGQTQSRTCIYSLEGDTLKICGKRPGGERPTEFQAKEGDGQLISVFQRVKD